MTFVKLNSAMVTVTIISLAILLFGASSCSSQQVSSGVNQNLAPKSVSSWLLASSNLSSSAQHVLSRSARGTIPWEWSIDALKCSLKILSVQVSQYHNNQLMCCGLWKMKAYIKRSAQEFCEKPDHSIAVFDDMIKEDVIYSGFAKSLLNDQTLDCAAYPEGSPICDHLFNYIIVIFILLVLTLIAIILGFCVSLFMCFYFRRKYNALVGNYGEKCHNTKTYKKAGSESDLSDTSSVDNNNRDKKQKPKVKFLENFKKQLLGPPKGDRPLVNFNNGPLNKDKLVTIKPTVAAPSVAANGLTGQNTPERCSSSASTNSSTVPSHKDDHQV